jgi:hypothetical protein
VGYVCAEKLIVISTAVSEMGVPQSEFQAYATMKYGKGFTNKEGILTAIQQEIKELGKSGTEAVRSYLKAQLVNAAIAA